MLHRLIAPSHVLRVLEFTPKTMDDPFQLYFREDEKTDEKYFNSQLDLTAGVGMSIFFSGHANCQSQSIFPSEQQEEDKSERRWIKKRPPSNQKIKVFIDGQRAATIYPHQWHRDRSGNIYIRSDKTRRWIREE